MSTVLASRGEAELDCRALVDHMLALEDHALVSVGHTLALRSMVPRMGREGCTAAPSNASAPLVASSGSSGAPAVAVVLDPRDVSTAEALPSVDSAPGFSPSCTSRRKWGVFSSR